MKKILFISLLLFGCKKQSILTTTQNNPIQSNNHTILLKWISGSGKVSREYNYPSGNSVNSLYPKYDTIYSGQNNVTYSYPQGVPNKYSYVIQGNTLSQNDSIEIQFWIDGVLKAKIKDLQFVTLNYQY